MKRILLLLSVAVLVVAMLAVTAVPAFATVHPLSRSERSLPNAPSGTPAATQDPPGISGGSNADNFAQPVSSVLPAGEELTPAQTGEEQTIVGTNPSPSRTAEGLPHAFENPIA